MQKTVLVIEDNEASLELFDTLLKSCGHDTMQARDGMEGLKLAREHQPDLILLDFLLPGLSGMEVAKIIKADRVLNSIPLIATTAFPFKDDDKVFQEGGFDDYIAKPVSGPDFIKIISKYLGTADEID